MNESNQKRASYSYSLIIFLLVGGKLKNPNRDRGNHSGEGNVQNENI